MKVNCESTIRHLVTVYLNGKKVEDAIEASEEDGYVWAAYRNAKGLVVPEIEAEQGAFIHEGMQVIKLTGQVRVELDTGPFIPIQPTVK